ncbi:MULTISPECIES: hypothetical protein [Brachybacterium]|uniref:Ig-like domain-containing protein n=1 Tax=Brachybacterium kimchii TaxID=2942909 RepID=A0ABY4N7M5_9MICO|nr:MULTISPECIES: hypothetical protein [Brachybacterium]MCG7309707.1 hypothetical protein [Brachybacterium sp. ACRRE]UQN30554.1 hypothetical protein M4486_04375 [Brachybacterium kimchii]
MTNMGVLMERGTERGHGFARGGLIALVVVVVLGGFAFTTSTKEEGVKITVTEKDRVVTRENSYYLVWSKEGETFKNSDSLSQGKFASSDLQGRLHEGTTYTCTVSGVRIPVVSTYRNILSCETAGK